jgi:hypothetical protein
MKCQWPDGCDITDPEMLQVDHIDGHGAGYRQSKEIGGLGHVLYRWLISNNFPPGYRLLCANHNWKHHANKRRERTHQLDLPIQ